MFSRVTLRQLCLGLTLLMVAFGVRVAAARWWEARLPAEQKFGFGDSEGYWELARTIATGQPYQYGEYQVFRTPGYPVLLAPLFWLSEGEPPTLWARIAGAMLGTLAVLLVMLLTRTLFNERAAWIAGLIATFYPGQIASSIFVLSEAPFIPLMLLQLWAWITAARYGCWRGKIGYAVVAGVIAGLATLVRPSWLLFTPFAIGLAILFSPHRKQHLLQGAVMMLALCVTMTPWWVRNYLVVGKFVPTSLQVGISLADGWNPEADGGSDLSKMDRTVMNERRMHSIVRSQWENGSHTLYFNVAPTFEPAVNKCLRDEAVAWAKQHPLRVLQLAGIKFLRMWNFIPNTSDFASWKLRAIYAVTYTPVLMACLAGLWTFRKQGFSIWLLFLPAVYFTLLHMIFVASIRYQQPAIMAWLVLGAGWLSKYSSRSAVMPSAPATT